MAQHFNLSKVWLGAKSKKAFDVATEFTFNAKLLVAICKDKVIVKKNSLFRLADFSDTTEIDATDATDVDSLNELLVLDCEPVHRGVLTVNTQFVVVDITDKTTTTTISDDSSGPLPEPLYLSDFTSALTVEDIGFNVSNPKKQNQQPLRGSAFFKVQALTRFQDFNFAGTDSTTTTTSRDDNYTIYIPKTLAQKHRLFNNCLVECMSINTFTALQQETANGSTRIGKGNGCIQNGVESKHKSKKKRNPSVAVVLIVDDEKAASDCVYTTPCFLFNALKNKEASEYTEMVLRKYGGLPVADVVSSCTSSWFCELPYATEVHIENVHSPCYSSGADFTGLLQQYFDTTRHVKKGDILAIPTKDNHDFWQESSSEGMDQNKPLVYFKVVKLLPKLSEVSTQRADRTHSILYVNGVCHSYAPVLEASCLTGGALYPPGLEPPVRELLQWARPLLTSGNAGAGLLLTGPPGSGKSSVVRSVALLLNMHYLQINCHELCGETSAATEARIKQVLGRAAAVAPCILNLQNIEVMAKDREGADDPRVIGAFKQQLEALHPTSSTSSQAINTEDNITLIPSLSRDWPVVVVATSSELSSSRGGGDLIDSFLHRVNMDVPTEKSRLLMLQSLLGVSGVESGWTRDGTIELGTDVNLHHVAQRTAGLVLGDLAALVSRVKAVARADITKHCSVSGHGLSWQDEQDVVTAGFSLCAKHFEKALEEMHAAQSHSIGAPKIPSVLWDDVGGLADVKADILDTIQLPLQHPDMFAAGLRRSGVLLYGPPGTGKTLLAKAVATECSLNFLSVKGPELINMYVGQSEENVRHVFARARSASPCVIFFDELDSLAPNRGRSGDSGGVMDRVVSQLLAELDGLHKACDVFVIGATNRPDLLDPALLRPGRFDKLLYLSVSTDRPSQLNILSALTRKFTLAEDCVLADVVERCPRNMTGADIYALCSDAMLNAIKRNIQQAKDQPDAPVSSNKKITLTVCMEDFLTALETFVPSVSEQELMHYQMVQAKFSQPASVPHV